MCIDPARFYKMEERLDGHIRDNKEDMKELKEMAKENAKLTNNLLAQQVAAKWVVKAFAFISTGVGFVAGYAIDYFIGHD